MKEPLKIGRKDSSRSSRPTIGFLIYKVGTPFGVNLWRGGVDAARNHDANFICFAGDIIHPAISPPEYGFEVQANILYELIDSEHLDGLVVCSNVLLALIDLEDFQNFCYRYHPLPMVSIGVPLEGLSYVGVDNYAGMYKTMNHLIDVHGYRRIVFIQGSEGSHEAEERYRAYTDALVNNNLSFDPTLVTPGNFRLPAGTEAIRILLDERNLSPGVDFEAIVAANDTMAFTAVEALQARGVHVPNDVAVVGFDDTEDAKATTPPLTTVRLSSYELGYQAVAILIAGLQSEAAPEQVNVPTTLVVRYSCGCLDPEVIQATTTSPITLPHETFEIAFARQREGVISEMMQSARARNVRMDPNWIQLLLDGFMAEMSDEANEAFLSALDMGLRQVIAKNGDVTVWQDAISILRRRVLPYLDGDEIGTLHRDRAENLWQQARVMIGGAAKRVQEYQLIRSLRRTTTLREVGAMLISTFDIAELVEVLAENLPKVGISSCYLSLYESAQSHKYLQPAPEWSQIILAYNEYGRVTLEPNERRFSSRNLVPSNLLPQDRPYNLVVESLYFRESQLGFVLLEANPQEINPYDSIYEALRREISSALQGALLVRQEEKRARQLQTVAEVSIATSTILDTAELLQRVVDLTKERFGLYHAHLYLLDKAGEKLALAAGAGEVGRQMVAQIWSIPLKTEQSLVARAARTRHGDMVNNVRADPGWLPNPLLPKTQAELAVPLIAGDAVLGVLDVQADEVNYFTEDDLRIQSTLAGQIAATIQNAGLFEQIALGNTEIQTLNERLKEENLRMEAELKVTRQLQQMLLPTMEELRQIQDVDIVGFMEPADEVGGDYYDVLQHNDQLKIGIGDVTGHGLESGVVMLMLQTAVRTLMTSEEKDPVRFLEVLNRTLHSNMQRMAVDKSLTLALLDYRLGQMRISGQHEQLIVVRRDGRVELQDTLDLGFPLGIETGIAKFVDELSIHLQPGDGVVLYSDGITEAENEAGEFYGLERLCTVVSQNWAKSAEAVKQAVVDDVHRFIGQQKVFDDLTLLIVRQQASAGKPAMNDLRENRDDTSP